MFLVIFLLVVIFLLYKKIKVKESFSSGGVNIQMNSNTISPVLDPYVYDIKPSQQKEYADTITYDMNHPYDVNGDGSGVTNMNGINEIDEIEDNELNNVNYLEGFSCRCGRCYN